LHTLINLHSSHRALYKVNKSYFGITVCIQYKDKTERSSQRTASINKKVHIIMFT